MQKKREEERQKSHANSIPHARDHTTAVAAIVLAGQPKLDEPLEAAWARALRHYKVHGWISTGALDGQIEAAKQLIPRILGHGREKTRLTEIFKRAPGWLLTFTGMHFDASLLGFRLPDNSELVKWGTRGYEESRRWPSLPSGCMADGDPVPEKQARLWPLPLDMTKPAKPPPDDENDTEVDLSSYTDAELDFLEDLRLAVDLAENPQMEKDLPRHQKLRLRNLFERFCRGDFGRFRR